MRVSLYIKRRLNKDSLNPIMYQVSMGRGEQKRISTKLAVNGKYYNNGQVGSRHPNYNDINISLRELRNKGEQAESKYMTGQLNNITEVIDFLNGKQNAESVDTFLHTILKDSGITEANYNNLRWCLGGFKNLMSIKGELMFTDVTNQLFAKYNNIGRGLVKQKEKAPKTLKSYGQAVTYICRQAYRMRQIKEPVVIDSYYMKFGQVYKEPQYHTWQEIHSTIKNTYTIEQWQSCALWLLMFGLRGINDVDISRISDKLLREIVEENAKEKLVSVENKDFMRELYLDYSRSKTGVPMIIRLFPPVITLIKYLKNSVVYTHIDKRCKNRGILRGLEDRLNIFEYDKTNNESFHRQLWKQRQNKFKVLSTDNIKFKNARSTFYQTAQGILGELDTKMLVGHKIEVSTDSYASVLNPSVVRKMNGQHLKVLKSYNYDRLVSTLVKQLYVLCGQGKAPNWVLANAITPNNKMLTIDVNEWGEITNNVVKPVKIEDKYMKYFKNQKDIEVELPDEHKTTMNNIFKRLAEEPKTEGLKVVHSKEKKAS